MRFTLACVVFGLLSLPAIASAQIKQPGAHPNYPVEIEPHLVVQWNDYAPCTNTGFGPGIRATIPFLDNGPIPKINNNMGIGFGLDWAHAGLRNNCYGFAPGSYDGYSTDIISVPVVVQWNFFLLPKLSVFGEAGLVIQHYRWDYAFDRGPGCNGPYCRYSNNTTDVDASFSAGGRFMFNDSVGFLLRLGYPYLSAGVSILL